MAKHNELGKKGEDAAVDYLKKRGYVIVDRNWTFHGYEIDIIAEYEEFLVFVEVKTRATKRWGNPEEAVGEQRMHRMVESAGYYIDSHDIDKQARFDIIGIVCSGDNFEVEHFEDAFYSF
ncbi:MAG: YraN family protein [Fermentimonas sp.]|jgi:putative endonuclease